ncbi:DNA gyrase C-terminal beta-propeller domain-containing protein [Jiulongibacter sp. NS-SX5]|uniref:DNA gyrase C-terminal beta-propeller domain-containing protein n=1 Tax=Jiulongibacter sp. NS-SX5 TaxID=3463854 RepID=UPI004059D5E0
MSVSDLRVMGRATQGVKLIKLNSNDGIASVTRIVKEEEDEESEGGEVDENGESEENSTSEE